MGRRPAIVLLLALGACDPGTHADEADLILGGGGAEFVPIADGARVPVIFGAQGGYHLWGSILVHGRSRRLAAGRADLRFTVVREGDAAATITIDTSVRLATADTTRIVFDGGAASDGGASSAPLTLDGPLTDWLMSTGSFVYVDEPGAIRNRLVRMAVEARGDDGWRATGERRFVPECTAGPKCPN